MTNVTLLIDSLVAMAAVIICLYYFLHRPNGKKWFNFITALVMSYAFLVHLLAYYNAIDPVTYGARFIRPYLALPYLIIGLHVWIDLKKPLPKGRRPRAKRKR